MGINGCRDKFSPPSEHFITNYVAAMGEWEGAAATFLKAPAIRKTLKAKKTHDTRQNAKGPMTWAPEATALLIRAACQSAGGLGPCKRKGRNKSGLDEKSSL